MQEEKAVNQDRINGLYNAYRTLAKAVDLPLVSRADHINKATQIAIAELVRAIEALNKEVRELKAQVESIETSE